MSQNFSVRLGCGIVAAVSLLAVGFSSQTIAQEIKQNLTPAPTVPSTVPTELSYRPIEGERFQALIDDVSRKPDPAPYYSTTIGCWLSGPKDPSPSPVCSAEGQPNCDCDSCQTPLNVTPSELAEAGKKPMNGLHF